MTCLRLLMPDLRAAAVRVVSPFVADAKTAATRGRPDIDFS